MKQLKNKKVFSEFAATLFIFVIIIFILVVFIWIKIGNQQNTKSLLGIAGNIDSRDNRNSSIIYENQNLRFSLELPKDWEGYYVTNHNGTIVFNLSEDLDGLFYITRHNKEEWQINEDYYKKGKQPSPGMYLGERGDYIYGAAVSPDLYNRQDLVEEIHLILQTFKFLD